jgi:hypothetical protein
MAGMVSLAMTSARVTKPVQKFSPRFVPLSLYWNCREFREGKRRGRCPYEHLGLKLPSYRFWDLLWMPTPSGAAT